MHFQVSPMLADTRTHTVPRAFEPHYLLKRGLEWPRKTWSSVFTLGITHTVRTALPIGNTSHKKHTCMWGWAIVPQYTWAVRSTSYSSRSCSARIHLGYLHSRQQSLCCPSQREMAHQHKGARIKSRDATRAHF